MISALVACVVVIAVASLGAFLADGWTARRHVRKLGQQGQPMLPHNPLLGHLLEAKTASEELPESAHSSYILNLIGKKIGKAKGKPADAFYFDAWPISDPLLVLLDPYLANQLVAHPRAGAQKPLGLKSWFAPISGRGGLNLFTQNGRDWKSDHGLFMPFFSNANLDAAMPTVIDEMVIFRDLLRARAASGDLFHLEPMTLSLMNDIIGHVVFNADLGNQGPSGPPPLSATMLRQLQLKFGTGPAIGRLSQLSPFRFFERWNNNRLLNKHIRSQIDQRAGSSAFRSSSSKSEDSSSTDDAAYFSLLDCALQSYRSSGGDPSRPSAEFLEMLTAQLRMFFFAGYDSTSGAMVALCYTLSLPSNSPVLSRLRAEHDSILGPNPSAAPALLSSNPSLLNSLPYTAAVIRETMRLLPQAGGIRRGGSDLVLRGRDGAEYPTEGCSVQMNHISNHRHPAAWERPLEFLPERFLAEEGGAGTADGEGGDEKEKENPLRPQRGAWRPFEYGARVCVGQALVMKELKAFLVLVAREFDVEECYDEVYGSGGGGGVDLTHVDGEKAYLVEAGAAHLRGHFPCRVRSRK